MDSSAGIPTTRLIAPTERIIPTRRPLFAFVGLARELIAYIALERAVSAQVRAREDIPAQMRGRVVARVMRDWE